MRAILKYRPVMRLLRTVCIYAQFQCLGLASSLSSHLNLTKVHTRSGTTSAMGISGGVQLQVPDIDSYKINGYNCNLIV